MQTSLAVKSLERVRTLTTCDPTAVKNSLKEHGALIVRAAASLSDFEKLSDQLMTPMVHHSTSTTVERDVVNADRTTSTVNKGMDYIPLHREGSYAPGCPDLLMLYCVRPADAGGETTLCDGVELLDSLPSRIRDFVDPAIVKWSWSATPERWMATLGVDSKDAAVAKLNKIKLRLPAWEKLDVNFNGDLLDGVFQTRCVIPTRWGNKRSFCNSLLIYHYRAATEYYPKTLYTPSLADGSPFPPELLEEIDGYAETLTHSVWWEENDILLFDNSRYMHGRTGFTDPERRILVRMGHVKPDEAKIRISEYDPDLVDEIVRFRRETYANSGRDPASLNEWSSDDLDRTATHVVMYNDQDKIIGVVRIIEGDVWSIEDYFDFEYDRLKGVEFGRLAISQPSFQGKRVLSELIKAACKHCAARGRTHFYGFVIARLRKELQRLGVPFEVLSPAVAPMGEDSFLVRFSVDELIRF
jgi:alpha-ketoglutarate-dependent taurine dioxygenase/N-acyl-L-homoserine lactone synthetase